MTERGMKLRIECPGLVGRGAHVWINDEDVSSSVSRIELAWDVNAVNYATITYLVRELEVDTETLVTGGADSAPPVHPLNPLSPHVRDPGHPAGPEPAQPPSTDSA